MSKINDETIEHRASSDGQYAIAYALLEVADALGNIRRELESLQYLDHLRHLQSIGDFDFGTAITPFCVKLES